MKTSIDTLVNDLFILFAINTEIFISRFNASLFNTHFPVGNLIDRPLFDLSYTYFAIFLFASKRNNNHVQFPI